MRKHVLFSIIVALLSGCGENIDKALLEKKRAAAPPPPEPPPLIDSGHGGEEPDPEPPPPGDSGETGGPPVETSTLQAIPSGHIGAMGVYVPQQVVGLRGKMVALGAGHGWRGRTSSESPGKRLQRPWVWSSGGYTYSSAYTSPVNQWAIVEDYLNSEITWYLNQYLRNAGAETTLVRELARQPNEVKVCPGATGYAQSGATFHTSTNDSAQAGQLCTSGTKYRYVYGDNAGNGNFSYTVNVSASGYYPVYYHY
ncbi:MAG: hypothetical protein NZL89_04985, partial [Leptospiraceae bacterium]|nr:hypothetical protein [Leptospiraceae bacterium]